MDILGRINSLITEEISEEDAKAKVMAFLTDKPNPPDDDIHAMAEKLGINVHKFEAYIYSILGSFLGAGRAKENDITEKDVDPKELKMGIKVEMEHTTNPDIAKRIALDHLAEIKDYYTRLKKMEEDAGIKD